MWFGMMLNVPVNNFSFMSGRFWNDTGACSIGKKSFCFSCKFATIMTKFPKINGGRWRAEA